MASSRLSAKSSTALVLVATGLVAPTPVRAALGNSSGWKRKPINRRGRANENEPTAGSVSTREIASTRSTICCSDFSVSMCGRDCLDEEYSCLINTPGGVQCSWSNGYISGGTCSGGCSSSSSGSRDNSCAYAYDGECDEPSYCETGTDTSDCSGGSSGGSSSGGSNSCQYAYDGECDEPSYCETGTDTSDCAAVAAGSCDKRALHPALELVKTPTSVTAAKTRAQRVGTQAVIFALREARAGLSASI